MHVVFQSGECMFNLILTSTRKCQALGPECTIPSRYDVHCIVSFNVSLLKNKQLGRSEKMFQPYTLIDWIVVDNSLLIYFATMRLEAFVVLKRLRFQNSDPQRGHLQPADQKELKKEERILYNNSPAWMIMVRFKAFW